jgi:hypothetical protein
VTRSILVAQALMRPWSVPIPSLEASAALTELSNEASPLSAGWILVVTTVNARSPHHVHRERKWPHEMVFPQDQAVISVVSGVEGTRRLRIVPSPRRPERDLVRIHPNHPVANYCRQPIRSVRSSCAC